MTDILNHPKENFVPLVLTWQMRQALQSAVLYLDVSLPSYFFDIYAVLVARYTQSTTFSFNLTNLQLATETQITIHIGKNPFFTDLVQQIDSSIPPITLYPVQFQMHHPNLSLTLELDVFDDEIHPYLAYSHNFIGRKHLVQLLEHYRTLFVHFTQRPGLYIESIPLKISSMII